MPETIRLFPPEAKKVLGTITIPPSKSESNRALLIRQLSNAPILLENVSRATDSKKMQALLASEGNELDVGNAGTVMRFLTAYLAFQPRDLVLGGDARMNERPIAPLVEALRELGADIGYLGQEGYPPLMIFGKNARFGKHKISISGGMSSQFISALLMIAPTLPAGLHLCIEGVLRSRPYVEMTLALMQHFGIAYEWAGREIIVAAQAYRAGNYRIDGDWSAVAFWMSIAALSDSCELELEGVRKHSFQGDQAITDIAAMLGIRLRHTSGGLSVSKKVLSMPEQVRLDFSHCPDLAQAVIVMLAALGVPAEFTGIESLRIKETDRIRALQQELEKCGVTFSYQNKKWQIRGEMIAPNSPIETYGDHRMAMAFAPLALKFPGIRIVAPEVVVKSYPSFWEDCRLLGFEVE